MTKNEIEKLKRKWLRMNRKEEQKIWQRKSCKKSPRNKTQVSRQNAFYQRDLNTY